MDVEANNGELRESGDGDSGGEYTNKETEGAEIVELDMVMLEKPKKIPSKIPIRQTKITMIGSGNNGESVEKLVNDENVLEQLQEANEIQTAGSNLGCNEQRQDKVVESISTDDLQEDFTTTSFNSSASSEEDLSEFSSISTSITILEAPEEFREVVVVPNEAGVLLDEHVAHTILTMKVDNECASVTVPSLLVLDGKVCANEQPTEKASSIDDAKCAQAPGCSRVLAAKVCAALQAPDPTTTNLPNPPQVDTSQQLEDLVTEPPVIDIKSAFEDDQFEPEESKSVLDEQQVVVLKSRDFNRRIEESRSRLKNLELKLKEAGITDEDKITNKPSYDANQNIVNQEQVEEEEEEDLLPDFEDSLCEFDVRQVETYNNGYYEVYDELESDSEDDGDEHYYHLIPKSTKTKMGGTEDQRSKHNPDRENLKSLLKKPNGNIKSRKNRVVFNEKKNEFFDADYIILIREECDYDEEDDDGVCTCNQHEMVRLTCCEPNCNCSVYDGYDQQTPQSPKFAPPMEFVDAVTLSPPEGYKDMELGEQQLLALQQMARRGQRPAVCRECSATHDDDEEEDDGSQGSADDPEGQLGGGEVTEEQEEKEKTDQSQQTTPTTPPNDSEDSQRYILETITMTSVSEQRIMREAEDEERHIPSPNLAPPGGSPISGILKGGRLWKQQSLDTNMTKPVVVETPQPNESDDESGGRRSVRFIEGDPNTTRDCCDGAPDKPAEEAEAPKIQNCNTSSPEATEMMLTFKLGNHVLISNNSLKPNSAVRQLFPCTTKPAAQPDESIHQYLVTAESLKAFEEAKRSKLPQIIQSGETDESIKRAIERNTLRRSLIRYEPRSKKPAHKTDNSLVERIKQLTCDVDDLNQAEARASPPGEEAHNSPPEVTKNTDKTFSPSSSSTASSNSSSMSSTYKKITDLFGKRQQDKLQPEVQTLPPDIGGPPNNYEATESNKLNESRRQFLSTLACVGTPGTDEYYYQIGERVSVASSVGTEYSLEDIDEGLKTEQEESKKIAPDVLAGTPSASESGDELAMFVQQDASRMERIKKKYQPAEPNKDDDDEHDDYGFNRRPSVRGIKPRFGSTTEILQQIQNQLQPSTAKVAWPYYSESDKSRNNVNMQPTNYQYANVPEEMKLRGYAPPQYRPTSLQEENMYQNCANQRCVTREVYRSNVNTYSSVVRVGGGCNEYYQSLPRSRTSRPQSPPPLELSKTYHQTMVYIPYNHIEGYQVPATYYQNPDYARVSNQNQINKQRYIEQPIYHHPNMVPPPKQLIRVPLNGQLPIMTPSRSESPLPGHFSTARATQTPAPTAYYATAQPRYRPVWQGDATGGYVTKMNRHSFPAAAAARYPDNVSLTDSENSQHSGQIANGYNLKESPTKPRFIERGVPEGAASVSPQDSTGVGVQSTPTSPQQPNTNGNKPMFYAMNV